MKKRTIQLLPLLLAFTGQANAATVVWDESVDGDLEFAPSFYLSAGEYSISGSLFAEQTSEFFVSGDSDTFFIHADPGTRIASVQYSLTGTNSELVDQRAELVLYNYATNASFGKFIAFQGGASGDASDVWPAVSLVGESVWDTKLDWAGAVPLGAYQTVDYTYTFTLTAVPLPAAAWLFGSALLGLGACRKRKTA